MNLYVRVRALLRSLMQSRLMSFVLIGLLSNSGGAQPIIPSKAYKLHAREERRNGFNWRAYIDLPSSVMALDREHSLLILVPQTNGAWVFKRLRSWDTNNPIEDTLDITGLKERGTKPAIDSINTDLTLSKDGRYVLVRINYQSGAIKASERNRSAIITVVDLRSFNVLSRQTTTDPLLADSVWVFNERNDLITRGLERRISEADPSSSTIIDHYSSAALKVPTLDVQDRCEYDSVRKLESGGTGWTKPIMVNASNGCAVLLKRSNVDLVEALPGPHKEQSLRFALGCRELDTDETLRLGLADCREGKSYADGMFVTTSSHTVKVFSTATMQAVLTIPLSRDWKGLTGLFARTESGNYAILLKYGVRLKMYRLP